MPRSIEAPLNPDLAKITVLDRAKRLPWDYLQKDKTRVIDRKLGALFEDLGNGRFWGVLAMIDGNNSSLPPDSPKQMQEARDWARLKFTEAELDEILQICIETALTVPKETAWPGTYKGHSIIYREIVAKKDSMFADKVRQEFKARLNNGRFWEELPDMKAYVNYGMAYRHAEDVLVNHFEELDPKFAGQGYKIFERNSRTSTATDFDLEGLSDKAKERYVKFVRRLSSNPDKSKLTFDQIAYLVKPYVEIAIGTHGEEDVSEANYPQNSKESFIKRLKDPMILAYLTKSDLVRKGAAKTLHLEMVYGNWVHGLSVLKHIPNPQEMFDRIVGEMVVPDGDLLRLLQKAQGEHIDLKPFMGPKSLAILERSKPIFIK